ncbi:MAG TPA: hypothetical protein VHZ96_26255 [Frankiaceae bacterium]|nr:hypothetical protein [Frankiaceae bacterium]
MTGSYALIADEIEALCDNARASHEAHHIAPFVFVDELLAALFPAEDADAK